MIPKELAGVLASDADILSGAVRFRGTRVHAKILFDYVLDGGSVEEFLTDYPEVARDSAEAVLAWERQRLDRDLLGKVA